MRAATKSVYLVIEIKCDESSARLIAGSAQPDLGQIMSNEQFRVISLETKRPNFDTPNRLDYFARPAAPGSQPCRDAGHKSLSELEKEYIEQVLASNGGNRSQTAKILNINRRTLQRKISQF
jgi:DNA-binding NtrC family response regulator